MIEVKDVILILFGLMIGNIFYQYFNEKDYKLAFERSYFQAVLAILLIIKDYL